MGLFLCYGEALGSALSDESLIDIRKSLLEAAAVKAVGDDALITDDVLSALKLFELSAEHLLFDAVADGFGFRLSLFHECLPLVESLDFVEQFIVSHCIFSFSVNWFLGRAAA